MPWLVSMRIGGLVKGTPRSVATRKSVILSSDGLEALITFCVAASTSSLLLKQLAKLIPAAVVLVDLKNDRRSRSFWRDGFIDIVIFLRKNLLGTFDDPKTALSEINEELTLKSAVHTSIIHFRFHRISGIR